MRPIRPTRIMLAALALALAAAPFAARPAAATWSTQGHPVAETGRNEAPEIFFDDTGTSICPDMDGGVFVGYIVQGTGADTVRVNRLSGANGARQLGTQGVLVSGPTGNSVEAAHLVSDGNYGCWVVWSDLRAVNPGLYCQRLDFNGVPQFAVGGIQLSPSNTSSGDSDLDIAVTPSGKLLVAYYENSIGFKVQRVTLAGAKDFGANGSLMSTDDVPFTCQMMADGEGGVVTWGTTRASLPGGAISKLVANRFNSAGTAQWGAEGAVVQAGASHSAQFHRSAWDGSNLFVTWKKTAIDPQGIRAQKLNGAGVAQWATTTTGLTVADFLDTPWDRYASVVPYPRIVSDAAGGCIIGWVDARDYDRPVAAGQLHAQDIYGQRLNSVGAPQWTGANGASLDSTIGTQEDLQMCVDEAGGVILVYTDLSINASTTEDDVRARRINASGASVWNSYINGPNPVDGEQNRPVIAADGVGGAFFAYIDRSDEADGGNNGDDVWATHRTQGGTTAAPGFTVLAPNGGESFTSLRPLDITWTSTLGGNVKIELSNGSFARSTIVASTPDDGAFTWLPNTSGSALKIYVSDATDGSPVDSSNATFSMCAALSAEQPYGDAAAANDLIEADLNEDGMLDIVTATNAGAQVSLGLGAGGVGQGAWGTPVLVATASFAQDVIADDFNDDGILDLAITTSSNGVQINFGNGTGGVGNGTFGSATTFATGAPARGIVSLDANEDGIRDLAVANGGTSVSILMGVGSNGVGTGGFAAAVNYASQNPPTRIVVGDFNEDGISDLAVTCSGANLVTVHLGQGAGGVGNGLFAAAVNYTTATNPLGICSGDFNEDGITDLAVAQSSSSGVGVFIGNGAAGVGNGTFAAEVNYAVGASVRDVAVIDLDGDGIADLAATHQTNDRVYGLFGLGSAGTGNGTFVAGGFEYGGDGPSQMIVGDFLEDGAPDVVTGGIASGNVNILEGYCPTALATTLTLTAPNGGQFFQTGTTQTVSWTKGAAVLAVDIELSRDGGTNWETIAKDVTGTSYAWTVTPQATGAARIRVHDAQLQNRVDASNANFTIFITPTLNVTTPNGGEVLQSLSFANIGWAGNSGGTVNIDLTSNGGATRIPLAAATTNDGAFLWTVPNTAGAGFRIRVSLASNGAIVDSSNATFAICARLDSVGALSTSDLLATVAADFNEDGILDIAGTGGGNTVFVNWGGGAAGVGNGQFVSHGGFIAGTNVMAVTAGDVNRDGRLDIVAATDNGAAVLLGNGVGDMGDGTFGAPTVFATGGDCSDVELADLNEDGILDIVAANINVGNIAVLIGQGANGVGNGSFAAPVTYGVKAKPLFLALNDFNGDGILDVAVSCFDDNVIAVRLGQGAGGVGNGTFAGGPLLSTNVGPAELLTGDFNEGGTVDLAVLCLSGSIQAFEGSGTGTFTLANTSPVNGLVPSDMAVGDFNGDTFPDLFVSNIANSTLDVYTNGSGPEFGLSGSVPLPAAPNCLVIGDFLEDGALDYALSYATTLRSFAGVACGLTFNGSVSSTLPVGGETFTPGTNQTLSWTKGDNVLAVNVELSRDNGRNWETIGKNVIGNSFSWTVTRPVTDSALVRVSDSTLPSRNDVTNSVFAIHDVVLDAPESLPVSASFSRPWPNPVRDVVRFEMALPRAADVTVEAYDITGRLVHTLARGNFAAGRHPLRWGGEGSRQIAAGVYFVRAHWEGFESVQRVVRLE